MRKMKVIRKAYRVRKDVKPGPGKKMKTIRVKKTIYWRKDVGAPGRGRKIIPSLEAGELTKHGYRFGASASRRHTALSKSVREDGYRTTLGRLIALQVFFKRVRPSYSKKAIADRKWLVAKFGGKW